jgi:hypothetical protein
MARLADTQTGNSKGSRRTKFSEVLSLARDESEPTEAEKIEVEKPNIQIDEYVPMQIANKSDSQIVTAPPSEPMPKSRKTGKRSNPDYVGAYFSIPKELHRQLDRYVMDLADEGIAMDRSQVVAEALRRMMNQ